MLPETLEYLENQQANLAVELEQYDAGTKEWWDVKKCIDGLNETMKDEVNRNERQADKEANRIERTKKEELDRQQSTREAKIARSKEVGKVAIQVGGVASVAGLATYMENHPDAMLSRFVNKVIDKVLRI